jgi:hypothetical protein
MTANFTHATLPPSTIIYPTHVVQLNAMNHKIEGESSGFDNSYPFRPEDRVS